VHVRERERDALILPDRPAPNWIRGARVFGGVLSGCAGHFYGTNRFDDFAQRVGISEAVAASRLKELAEAGLLERQPYRDPSQQARLEYKLTDMSA
jgi:hypothetical protein